MQIAFFVFHFIYMAYFEAFCWSFLSGTNPEVVWRVVQFDNVHNKYHITYHIVKNRYPQYIVQGVQRWIDGKSKLISI